MRIVPLLLISIAVGSGAAWIDASQKPYLPLKPISAHTIAAGASVKDGFEIATRNALAATRASTLE